MIAVEIRLNVELGKTFAVGDDVQRHQPLRRDDQTIDPSRLVGHERQSVRINRHRFVRRRPVGPDEPFGHRFGRHQVEVHRYLVARGQIMKVCRQRRGGGHLWQHSVLPRLRVDEVEVRPHRQRVTARVVDLQASFFAGSPGLHPQRRHRPRDRTPHPGDDATDPAGRRHLPSRRRFEVLGCKRSFAPPLPDHVQDAKRHPLRPVVQRKPHRIIFGGDMTR